LRNKLLKEPEIMVVKTPKSNYFLGTRGAGLNNLIRVHHFHKSDLTIYECFLENTFYGQIDSYAFIYFINIKITLDDLSKNPNYLIGL
jgi:hypothetical protein